MSKVIKVFFSIAIVTFALPNFFTAIKI